ncbi:MAG: NADH-quinone oxidoreductase subunit C [Haloarculaceae archaeon]
MSQNRLKRDLAERLPDADVTERRGRLEVALDDRDELRNAVGALDDLDVTHLITITGVDAGDEIDVLYHFLRYGELSGGDLGAAAEVTVRVAVPRDDPTVASITGQIPAANLYERELMDMLGVEVTGHPNPEKFLLPDDWEGEPPLLTDDGEVS